MQRSGMRQAHHCLTLCSALRKFEAYQSAPNNSPVARTLPLSMSRTLTIG
jgi:hypothetical protein